MALGRVIETTIGKAGQAGLKISGLRQSFLIEKTDRKGQNKCSLTIYGIAKSKSAYAAKGNVIQISAGYADEGIQPIFYGVITHSEGENDKGQYVIYIEATDGQSTVTDKYLSLSYEAKTPKATAFKDIKNVLALPTVPAGFTLSGNLPNGYSFIGRAVDALTEILRSEGYTWSIQNEKITIYIPGEPVQNTGVLLSFRTGLLAEPEALTGDEITGYSIKSLLHPQIIPGSTIRVESAAVTGVLRVKAVVFDADSEESDFIAMTEAAII